MQLAQASHGEGNSPYGERDLTFIALQQWFDTAAFIVPPDAGRLGKSARNQVRFPGIHNWDLAVHKNFPGVPWFAGEKASVQFRAEMFNAWNHTQFYNVDANFQAENITVDTTTMKVTGWNLNNPTYGRVTRMRDPREIQFALKLL